MREKWAGTYKVNYDSHSDGLYLTTANGGSIETDQLKELVEGLQRFIENNSPQQVQELYATLEKEQTIQRLTDQLQSEMIYDIPSKDAGYVLFCKRETSDIYWITYTRNLEGWKQVVPKPWNSRSSIVKSFFTEEADARAQFLRKHFFNHKNLNMAWFRLGKKDLDAVGTDEEQQQFDEYLSKIMKERVNFSDCTYCGKSPLLRGIQYTHEKWNGAFCSRECFAQYLEGCFYDTSVRIERVREC